MYYKKGANSGFYFVSNLIKWVRPKMKKCVYLKNRVQAVNCFFFGWFGTGLGRLGLTCNYALGGWKTLVISCKKQRNQRGNHHEGWLVASSTASAGPDDTRPPQGDSGVTVTTV